MEKSLFKKISDLEPVLPHPVKSHMLEGGTAMLSAGLGVLTNVIPNFIIRYRYKERVKTLKLLSQAITNLGKKPSIEDLVKLLSEKEVGKILKLIKNTEIKNSLAKTNGGGSTKEEAEDLLLELENVLGGKTFDVEKSEKQYTTYKDKYSSIHKNYKLVIFTLHRLPVLLFGVWFGSYLPSSPYGFFSSVRQPVDTYVVGQALKHTPNFIQPI